MAVISRDELRARIEQGAACVAGAFAHAARVLRAVD